MDLPADWSGAAAFLAAAAVTGRAITLGPLDATDTQGDRALVEILGRAGCEATWNGAKLTLKGPLQGELRAVPGGFAARAAEDLHQSAVPLGIRRVEGTQGDGPARDRCGGKEGGSAAPVGGEVHIRWLQSTGNRQLVLLQGGGAAEDLQPATV